jgi:hypothetical protein
MNNWIQSIIQMKTLAKYELTYTNGELAKRVDRIDGKFYSFDDIY